MLNLFFSYSELFFNFLVFLAKSVSMIVVNLLLLPQILLKCVIIGPFLSMIIEKYLESDYLSQLKK
ncbi:hypothetical protein CBG25_00665 [Arsenophonus sp. ENCA]|nr:hypothetical protein CBG25_00665 [Arsenophonus sp. ENCA]